MLEIPEHEKRSDFQRIRMLLILGKLSLPNLISFILVSTLKYPWR